MIKFPALLPAPSQDFSITPDTNMVRTNMDSGRTRQRKKNTQRYNSAQITWQFDDTEFSIFKGFLYYEAQDGAGWFEANLFTGETLIPHKIRLVNGQYTASYTAWGGWAVSATVDLERVNLPEPGVYYWLQMSDRLEIKNKLEYAVNKILPPLA